MSGLSPTVRRRPHPPWRAAAAWAGMAWACAASAAPINLARGEVFDNTTFAELVNVPTTVGAIATTSIHEQQGGPLESSFVRGVARLDGFIAAASRTSVELGGDEVRWSAYVQYRDTYTNGSLAPQHYVFDFDIFRMSLEIFDLEGVEQSASIIAQVQLNLGTGPSRFLFRIDERLVGGLGGVLPRRNRQEHL